MDSHEIGLFFLRLFIVREDRLLLKLMLFSGTEFYEIDTRISVRVSAGVLRRYFCSFRLLVLLDLFLSLAFSLWTTAGY